MAEINRELISRPGSPILTNFKAGRERARREPATATASGPRNSTVTATPIGMRAKLA